MTLVSVLVPTLDAPGLGDLLNAVLDQERPGFEVQLVIAGRDATGAAATSRVTFVGTPSPVSPARARNLAAREATGDLLAFLDADCIPEPDWLETLAAAHEGFASPSLLGGSVLVDGETGWALVDDFSSFHAYSSRLPASARPYLPALDLSLRRSLWERLGPFDETLRYAEDLDLTLRARRLGVPVVFRPELKVRHRSLRRDARSVIRKAFLTGRVAVPVRLRHRQLLPSSRLLSSRALLFAAAPLAAALTTGKALWHAGGGWRAFASAPGIFAAKLAWCLGAALRPRGERTAASPHPRHLVLFVTDRCPASCRHCFHAASLDRGAKLLEPAEIERLAAATAPLSTLSLSGGEPFLREDLADLVGPFAARGLGEVFVPTSGLFPERVAALCEELLSRWPRLRVAISLSLDGPPQLHDSLRGVPGTFSKVRATHDALTRLKRGPFGARFRLKVGTVLGRENADSLPGLFELVARDLPSVDFHDVEILRGAPPAGGLTPPSADLLETLRPVIRASFRRGSLLGTGRPVRSLLARAVKGCTLDLAIETLRSGRSVVRCHAAANMLVVGDEGEVRFCELGPSLGSLREADLNDLLARPTAQRIREDVARGSCFCFQSGPLQRSIARTPRLWPRLVGGLLGLGESRPRIATGEDGSFARVQGLEATTRKPT